MTMTPEEVALLILSSAVLLLSFLVVSVLVAAACLVVSQSSRLWRMVDESRRAETQARDSLNSLLMAELPATPTPPQRFTDGSDASMDDPEDRHERQKPHVPTDADFAAAFGVRTPDDLPISAQYETGNPRVPGFSFANGRG